MGFFDRFKKKKTETAAEEQVSDSGVRQSGINGEDPFDKEQNIVRTGHVTERAAEHVTEQSAERRTEESNPKTDEAAGRMDCKAFLLCMEENLEEIMNRIGEAFGMDGSGSGNTLELQNGDMKIRILAVAQSMGEEAEKFVKDQVSQMWGHFHQTETEAVNEKINALYQLKLSRSIVNIDYSFLQQDGDDKKSMIEGMLASVLDELKGLMLIVGEQDGLYVLEEEGKVALILSDDGQCDVKGYMPFELQGWEEGEGISKEQTERRRRSRAVLKERKIYVPAFYPVIESEEEAACKSVEEIVGRTAALAAVSLFSECLMGEGMSYEEAYAFIDQWMKSFGVEGCLSPEEDAYLHNPDSTEEERISFSWQYEALYVMEWALGLIEELDAPVHICDVSLAVRQLKACENLKGLAAAAKKRTPSELLDECDLIFCLDWACVDSRIHDLPAPAGMDGGVVQERHRALNWLVGSNDAVEWDDVSTDT